MPVDDPGKTGQRDVVVVVPTYCEAQNIVALVRDVLERVGCRILVVDDDSPDGTAGAVSGNFSQDDRVRLLNRKGRPRGLGRAYADGFVMALEWGARAIVQMDADFSHPPRSIPKLLAALEHADLAIGSRYVGGGRAPGLGPFRAALSRLGGLWASTALGLGIRDPTSGFKAWSADALRKIDPASLTSTGFVFQIETNWLAVREGMRVVEVPIVFEPRRGGESKMSADIVLEAIRTVRRLRRKGSK
ncbi:MAG: polyprenol monophosphomannose synthase [Deltaproteobacteria bacterium]|nr:MAG: polyprenol monophosphomannose synthase [Deltaproteobacteria bacterium]